MSKSKTLMGFVAGAAVGVLAGFLLAPEKGSESRKKISDMSGDLGASFTDKVSSFMNGIRHSFSGAAASTEKLVEKSTSNISDIKNEAQHSFS